MLMTYHFDSKAIRIFKERVDNWSLGTVIDVGVIQLLLDKETIGPQCIY